MKNSKNAKSIVTPEQVITLEESGIIRTVVTEGSVHTREVALKYIESVKSLTSTPRPLIVDVRQIGKVTGDAQKVYGGSEHARYITRAAFIVKNSLSSHVGNLFVSNSMYDVRVFSNEEYAERWVKLNSVHSGKSRFRSTLRESTIAFFTLCLLVIFSFGVFIFIEKSSEGKLQEHITARSDSVKEIFVLKLNERLVALDRMAGRFRSGEAEEFLKWQKDADSYLKTFSGFQAIEWADEKTKLKWIHPLEGNEAAVGLVLNFEGKRKHAIELALKTKKGTITKPINLKQGGLGLLSLHPTYSADVLSGYIVGVYRIQDVFSEIIAPNFNVGIKFNNKSIFFKGSDPNFKKSSLFREFEIKVRNQTFTFELTPTQELKAKYGNIGNMVALVVMIMGSFIFSLFLYSRLKAGKKYNKLNSNYSATAGALNASAFVIELNSLGNIIYANDRFYSKTKISEMTVDDDKPFDSLLKNGQGLKIKDALLEQGRWDGEFNLDTKMENDLWVHCSITPKYDYNSNPDGFLVIMFDITKRRGLQEQLNQSSKLASVGQLAAGVGHEINNPLAIVKGYLSTIRNKLYSVEDPDLDNIAPYFDKVENSILRITKIIHGLRTFSHTRDHDLNDVYFLKIFKETFSMIEEIYSKDNIELIQDIQIDESYYIEEASSGKLLQIFMNLLVNAKDAVENEKHKKIIFTVKPVGDSLSISIKDNGAGIHKVVQKRIFDPFFTTKDVNKGTGIGLSLVHNITQEHGGNIVVESEEGEGAEFLVTLPFKVNSSLSNIVEIDKKKKAGLDCSILIVDDEEAIREIVGDILVSFGAKVFFAEDGKEALELYKDSPERYDIVVSDMKMPIMDGPTFVKELRKEKTIKQPKFIFFTGGIDVNFEDKNNELSKLIDGYFFKPLNEDQIFDVVASALKSLKELKSA